MYLDIGKVRSGNKVYTRVLLRESYRQDGKVKHRTIANLSKCSDQEIAAFKLALQHKHDLVAFGENAQPNPNFTLRQGLSIGAVAVLEALARELGLAKALGTDREGKLALWQVIARAIDQGSRLSAVRLAQTHACCDLLKLDAFNEDDLYSNLAWLTEHQHRTEKRLFEVLHPGEKPALFLYDVTSSYLEGSHNHLGTFGYNRDGKSWKDADCHWPVVRPSRDTLINRSICGQYFRSQDGRFASKKNSRPFWRRIGDVCRRSRHAQDPSNRALERAWNALYHGDYQAADRVITLYKSVADGVVRSAIGRGQ